MIQDPIKPAISEHMRIEKKNDYSRGKWRLVYPSGNDVYWLKPMDHPTIGTTWVSAPVCGDTKQECIDETLQLLALMLKGAS